MIIIEGVDNSGKTTLGAQLQRDLKIPLVHSVRPSVSASQEDVLRHSRLQLQPQRVILDRVYAISEPIYGTICRGESDLGPLGVEAMLDLLSRNHLIIYCRPRDSTILRNAGRDQMDGVLQNHQALIDRYDRVFEDISAFHSGTVVYYDWTQSVQYINLLAIAKKHLQQTDSVVASATFLNSLTGA